MSFDWNRADKDPAYERACFEWGKRRMARIVELLKEKLDPSTPFMQKASSKAIELTKKALQDWEQRLQVTEKDIKTLRCQDDSWKDIVIEE